MTSTILQTGDWRQRFKFKLRSADECVLEIKSGQSIYVHSHAASPEPLLDALVRRADSLSGVKLLQIMTLGKAPYAAPQYRHSFQVNSLFIGPNVRSAVNDGRAEYIPTHLSDIPKLFSDRLIPVDVCLLQVSRPDAHGYCSLGVSVDCTIAAVQSAGLVIAEVNSRMPRTFGRSMIHVDQIDFAFETDRPLPELAVGELNEVERAIGCHVAGLVENGATIQLGIGGVPDAVLAQLKNHVDLGVHSEMLSDGIVDLVESGAITNRAKTVLPGKLAVSFVMGSKRLYDYVDDNPEIEFQPVDFINDPFVIAQNYKMTSINSALEVDLTGQVAADTIGGVLFSGVGGQVDFVRGASKAKGGKSIIAMPSTAKNGQLSRIKSVLTPGSAVTTSRADVSYIVTEYGIARLHGATLRERMRALINIAHPLFREELERHFDESTRKSHSLGTSKSS